MSPLPYRSEWENGTPEPSAYTGGPVSSNTTVTDTAASSQRSTVDVPAMAVTSDAQPPRPLTPVPVQARKRLPELETLTLRELRARSDLMVPPDTVLPQLAYRGRVTMLSGREKGGKSTLVAAGVSALSNGQPFLNEPTAPCDVLWLSADHEAWYDITKRFEVFHADLDRVSVVVEWHDQIEDFMRLLETRRPGLVVIDTLAAFANSRVQDAVKSHQWFPVLLPFEDFAHRTGCAVLFIHHANKSGSQTYRDSSAIGGCVDIIIEQKEPPQEHDQEGSRRTFNKRGRTGREDFAVRFYGDRFELEGNGERRDLRDRVLAFLADHPRSSRTAVRDGVGGKAERVDAHIEGLSREGLILDLGTGGKHAYALAH